MKTYKVLILPFAEGDLSEIISYFYSTNPEYSKTLYLKLKEKINMLVTFPERGIIVPELEKKGFFKYRQIIEGNYRIIYSIISDIVYVHIIVDSRRNLEEVLINKLHH